jgi:hypothetical protein
MNVSGRPNEDQRQREQGQMVNHKLTLGALFFPSFSPVSTLAFLEVGSPPVDARLVPLDPVRTNASGECHEGTNLAFLSRLFLFKTLEDLRVAVDGDGREQGERKWLNPFRRGVLRRQAQRVTSRFRKFLSNSPSTTTSIRALH